MTNLRQQAQWLEELILNTDDVRHKELDPAQIRHNLDRIQNHAFTDLQASRYLGFVTGVALALGWIDWKKLESISDETYRAEPRPATSDQAKKRVGRSKQSAGDPDTVDESESGSGDA